MHTLFVLVCVVHDRKQLHTDHYLALDLNYKLAYAESKWDPEPFEEGVRNFEELVHAPEFILYH